MEFQRPSSFYEGSVVTSVIAASPMGGREGGIGNLWGRGGHISLKDAIIML